MLWQYIGWATLAGIGAMMLFMPINGLFARWSKRIRKEKYKVEDSRIKMMNEILTGIRVIKLYGWETSFKKLVEKLRDKELKYLIQTSLLSSITSFIFSIAPFVVAGVSFATFILMDEKNNLDANTAFVSLTLFSMLKMPLNFIPYIINGLIQLNVSLTRIRKFLLKDEFKLDDVTHDDVEGLAVGVENVDFGWTKAETLLKQIRLNAKKGQLVAILGRVGAGKSSLLTGLLGEMHKLNEGKVNVNGSVAYVPQQAWIQNATLKNNILFSQTFDDEYYKSVVKACSLETDLDLMPAGDETEIGEKGINLSGGQKQRVSLARAVYSNADIYMLDDPLSAVDSHVGKAIFDSVIGPNGMLKQKTRLFVTNSLSFLPQVDQIIMIDDGYIIETGTYVELKRKEGAFTDFIKSFVETHQANQKIIKEMNQLQRQASKKSETTTGDEAKKEEANNSNEPRAKSARAGEKIIEKEKIESGRVKLRVALVYLKACSLVLSIVFIALNIISEGSNMSSSYWLSAWSNEADKIKSANLTANSSSLNDTSHPMSKYSRLAVYSAFGFFKALTALLAGLCFLSMRVKGTSFLHNKLLYCVLRSNLR
jgi:ATP-binding cassette subfamily C (CFTR/MRP) protein 1